MTADQEKVYQYIIVRLITLLMNPKYRPAQQGEIQRAIMHVVQHMPDRKELLTAIDAIKAEYDAHPKVIEEARKQEEALRQAQETRNKELVKYHIDARKKRDTVEFLNTVLREHGLVVTERKEN